MLCLVNGRCPPSRAVDADISTQSHVVDPIEVHSPDGLIRFNTPVKWIVPIGSIIDYVVSWLRLPTETGERI